MGLMKWLGFAPEKDPVALDDGNFHQEVRKADEPVLVDIWSPGCAPCDALAPTIKRLAAAYDGKVKGGHVVPSTALPTRAVRDLLEDYEACKARHKLLILDACHSGGEKGALQAMPRGFRDTFADAKTFATISAAFCPL